MGEGMMGGVYVYQCGHLGASRAWGSYRWDWECNHCRPDMYEPDEATIPVTTGASVLRRLWLG